MPRATRDMTTAHREITKRVKKLSDTFIDCRDPGLRHAWMRENDFHVVAMQTVGKKIEALGRDEVCMRCGTVKHEKFIVGRNGIEKTGQSYEYPQGYAMPGVPRGVKPSTVIHQEQYRRAMERAAKAEAGQRETADR